ncbi:putative thiamine pyrophosphate-containing protein YdaP [Amycolatopsis sp. M39]|nr:putative thiamine pyrophosphate-containing protein YdaP [Amycolatopsis sp. M39]
MGGASKFEESPSLPDVDYVGFALFLGLTAITVDKPDQLAAAWETALSGGKPAVLDVRCDPEVPPIPPHATFEQMKSAAQPVLKGDPDAFHLVVQGVKTKLQEFLPGRN